MIWENVTTLLVKIIWTRWKNLSFNLKFENYNICVQKLADRGCGIHGGEGRGGGGGRETCRPHHTRGHSSGATTADRGRH